MQGTREGPSGWPNPKGLTRTHSRQRISRDCNGENDDIESCNAWAAAECKSRDQHYCRVAA
jgi:hypothetical protein